MMSLKEKPFISSIPDSQTKGRFYNMSSVKQGQTRDMTQGSALSNILVFAIPLFISNFFQQCYNIGDTMIASHNLGQSALAAIGLTGSITGLVIGFANGINSGYGILLARAFGSKNEEQMKSVVAWTLILNLGISILITIGTLLFADPLLHLIQTPEDVFSESRTYLTVVMGGMATALFYNMGSGLLRAVGNSKTPLYFLIFSCSLNLLLDLLSVTVFHFGVAGIAGATVMAQLISSILCFLYLYRNFRFLIPSRRHFSYNKRLVSDLVSTGFSMGLMNSIFSIGSVILQGSINTLGTTIIAAHTAARRIVMIGNMPLSSIASANATFVSQNFGAGRIDRIREGIKKSSMISLIWSLLFLVMILTLANPLIRALAGTDDPVIMSNAMMNLHINMIFFFPLGILLIIRMTLQGINHKTIPLISSTMELIIKVLASFVFVPLWGYVGASIAEPFSWLVCMLFLLFSYIRILKKEKIYS